MIYSSGFPKSWTLPYTIRESWRRRKFMPKKEGFYSTYLHRHFFEEMLLEELKSIEGSRKIKTINSCIGRFLAGKKPSVPLHHLRMRCWLTMRARNLSMWELAVRYGKHSRYHFFREVTFLKDERDPDYPQECSGGLAERNWVWRSEFWTSMVKI